MWQQNIQKYEIRIQFSTLFKYNMCRNPSNLNTQTKCEVSSTDLLNHQTKLDKTTTMIYKNLPWWKRLGGIKHRETTITHFKLRYTTTCKR